MNEISGYAIIASGRVVNVVVSDAEFAALMGWVQLRDNVGIGWYWTAEDGFIAPWEVDPPEVPPAEPPSDQQTDPGGSA